jgi:hypothetical protein
VSILKLWKRFFKIPGHSFLYLNPSPPFFLPFIFFPSLLSASFSYPQDKRITFQINEYLTFSRCLWQHIFTLQRTKFKTLNTKLLSTKNLKFFQYSIMCKPCATIITTVIASYKEIPKDWKKKSIVSRFRLLTDFIFGSTNPDPRDCKRFPLKRDFRYSRVITDRFHCLIFTIIILCVILIRTEAIRITWIAATA